MIIASGRYTGNGTSQSIVVSAPTFQPRFVMIKGVSGTTNAVCTIDSMGADVSKDMANAVAVTAGAITSLNATGFSVGSNAMCNTNLVIYDWLAIGNGGAADIASGTYIGNSGTPPTVSLTPATFLPGLIIVIPVGASTVRLHHTSTAYFGASSGSNGLGLTIGVTNGFASISIGSIVIGASAATNTNTVTYAYIALRGISGLLGSFTYAGDASDDVTRTGLGFQPQNAWTKKDAQTTQAGWRSKGHVGDLSNGLQNQNDAVNIIQAFTADGFQTGTNSIANAAAQTYFAVGFRDGVSVASGKAPPGRGGGNPGGGGKGGGTPPPPLGVKFTFKALRRRTR